MDVGLRRVSPLKLVGVGGTAILALIGIGLFPPDGRFTGGRGSDAAPPVNELPVAPTSAVPDTSAGARIPGAEAVRDSSTRSPVLIVTVNPTPAETTRPDDDAGDAGGGGAGAGGGSGNGGGADQDEDQDEDDRRWFRSRGWFRSRRWRRADGELPGGPAPAAGGAGCGRR